MDSEATRDGVHDILVVAAAKECKGNHVLCILLETFELLRLPVAWNKLESPKLLLTFLGFELDSLSEEIRTLGQKLEDIRRELEGYRNCEKKNLKSLVGCCCWQSTEVREDIHAPSV